MSFLINFIQGAAGKPHQITFLWSWTTFLSNANTNDNGFASERISKGFQVSTYMYIAYKIHIKKKHVSFEIASGIRVETLQKVLQALNGEQ